MSHADHKKQGLEMHGITKPGKINWNLDAKELLETALANKEGVLTNTGALSCETGEHTGRSPKDKFVVRDATTEAHIDWGTVNQSMTPENFAALRADQLRHLEGKELFVRDAFGGADKEYRLPIRVINETAWANLFCRHLFVRPTAAELTNHIPQFTIIHTPSFSADPKKHGTNCGTFIAVNFTEGLILIGGTNYAGEMKKSIFTILNYLYPFKGIFPMHCSANVGSGSTALFFGLSGTGKTTLSADPNRRLIGDDEHGWGDRGVFNFEGGCYAKCINLTKENEPQIFNAIRDSAILENVVIDAKTGAPDYFNVTKTENTRAAYPVEYIDNAILEGTGPQPTNIIFLTCDAFGVMPPISKLTPEQAMYHFLSGYTAKVAGTEKGMGNTPTTTFSACFGAPFLPLAPTKYAEMLGASMKKHSVNCWLVNTGWVGGGVGVGNRIKLTYTRRMVQAALDGELKNTTFRTDAVFGLAIPESIKDVPAEVLDPKLSWKDGAAYDASAKDLAGRFKKNFEKFKAKLPQLESAGPIVG